ncbi:MAG: chemotaxis response regulator protein-glutamate methylesterase [Leptospiraceae bacterium]|nr:chemotaxis response regulator protein-glutamate methylesterase [Leptospiraceae bacterium]MCP5493667.1 chemotaxis response regulator protein-glutamate methylesterase [Leptospiraceae bacterium]
MPKTRVLIVDDSVVSRKFLSMIVSDEEDMEVAGVAASGKIGLDRISQVNPDLIVLDIEMPDMDGITTLKRIRESYPKLPVIMFSSLTKKASTETLDAIAAGANDYVTKPSQTNSPEEALQNIKKELIPKIRALCKTEAYPSKRPSITQTYSNKPKQHIKTHSVPASSSVPSAQIKIVVIGISTGGPNALATMLPSLPGDFPVPIVIVQHLPPIFTNTLAERLDRISSLKVVEAKEGDKLIPGKVFIAPGDYHTSLKRFTNIVVIGLDQGPVENSLRPAADVLFRSAAKLYGNSVLGVVMTGMGQDGLRGSESIREAGGTILVQDEESSVVWGMPGSVSRAGLAHLIVPLNEIASEIIRLVG